ncbi:MAG TPA: hypothetical protein VKE94_19385 [Gemmataceae bacterium]|nr:hypothetical protein [Gemmataceae bacterium]
MRRFLIPLLGVALVAAGVAAWSYFGPVLAAAPSVAGTWKLTFFPPDGTEISLWLIQIEAKDGELTGKVLSAPNEQLKEAKVAQFASEDKELRFKMQLNAGETTIEFPVTVRIPDKGGEAKLLRGTIVLNGQKLFAQLERTDMKELDAASAQDAGASGLLLKALKTRDAKDQEKLFKDVIAANADKPAAYYAGVGLVGVSIKQGAAADDLRKHAEAAVRVAAEFGPDMERTALAEVASQLARDAKSAPVAVDFARQAEKTLTDADPPAVTMAVLKTLAGALRKSDKASEAATLQARIDKLEDALDKEFLKDAVPFKPKAHGGRAGDDNRVVLVELFTGAQCPPCVAADVAFDALLKTYKPADVAFLQYHLHIPGPDPLTNADSEKRGEYYDLGGTPTYYLNGKTGPAAGGPKQGGQQAYGRLEAKIAEDLKSETKTKLKLTAQRKGDAIDIGASVSGLETTGDKVRLRFVLVEDVVRYQGRNGQRLHHHVVRAFPGGVEGAKLDKAESKHAVALNLAELSKSLGDYLTASNEKRPFLDDERPLNLKNLKVVAFIQNDDGKQVLQAAQVDVEEAK